MENVRIMRVRGGTVSEEPVGHDEPLDAGALAQIADEAKDSAISTVYGEKVVLLLGRDDVNTLVLNDTRGDMSVKPRLNRLDDGETAILGAVHNALVVECEKAPSKASDIDFIATQV